MRRTVAGLGLIASLITAAGLATSSVAMARPTTPARADAARVAVAQASADPDYATDLTVSGSGFQSIKGGFGGIYVMFGAVDDHWRPSQGGVSGVDYDYVHDEESKANHGFLKFVAFPGSSTEAEANGGTISADGRWSTTLVVPGARFPAVGRNGAARQVDCRQVRCGVITIGAHGVVNPSNETFTPVRFATPNAAPAPRTTPSRPASSRPASPSTTPTKRTTAASRPPATTARPTRVTPSSTVETSTLNATPVAAPTSDSAAGAGRIALIAGLAVAVVVLAGLGRLFLRRRRAGTS